MTPTAWAAVTGKIFTAAGVYKPAHFDQATQTRVPAAGCTNHSIRRSAAQWAGRCDGRTHDVANNGRWKSFEEMMKYLAQGATIRHYTGHHKAVICVALHDQNPGAD